MSYTNPLGNPQGDAILFTNKIREALIAEIVAINQYANHIANSNINDINNVWRENIQDEKNHYGLFLNLIRKYDPIEYQEYLRYVNEQYNGIISQNYKPNYDDQIILNNVREDIKGEFEAIILYEQLVTEIPYQDIKEVFKVVIDDEKEHVEHLTRVLLNYDPNKYDDLK